MASANASIKEVLTEKAHELFQLCDRENKGFIGKRDMQRMIKELPLEPDQLEDVFDSLDIDGNGFLTLEEFTSGFGSFLGLDGEEADWADEPSENEHQEREQEREQQQERQEREQQWRQKAEEEQDEEEQFRDFIMLAGAGDLVGENDVAIQQMWQRLVHDSNAESAPVLLDSFARLLGDISGRVRQARSEQESLEGALRQQQDTMQTQMKNIFEEMEAQIAAERTQNNKEEEQKQLKIREELQSQVAIKDLEAQMSRQRAAELSAQLGKLTSSEALYKQENAELQKKKDEFEEEMRRQKRLIVELQTTIEQNRSLTLEEKRKRAKAAFSVTESIASEREDLVKQLDLLKSINTKLMDERDSGVKITPAPRQFPGDRLSNILSADELRDSNNVEATISQLITQVPGDTKTLQVPTDRHDLQESDCEVDEVFYQNNPDVVQRVPAVPLPADWKGPLRLQRSSLMDELLEGDDVVRPLPAPRARTGVTGVTGVTAVTAVTEVSGGSETDDQHTVSRHRKRARNHGNHHHSSTLLIYHQGQTARAKPDPAGQNDTGVVGGVNGVPRSGSPTPSATSTLVQPQRVYKVVIIGDAGVGKSSFVQRFCTGEVRPSYAATIGVDFQVQTVVVDDQTVCIQLWDTAGQERFRSITKQYFRKADGVFIMFDVTSETSFRNCREWIQNVKDLAAEETCLILLGNKTDLCPDPTLRVVKPNTGEALAADCGAVYHECSALRDVGVTSVMEMMAEMLLQKEDASLEMALRLVPQKEPRKRCCKK